MGVTLEPESFTSYSMVTLGCMATATTSHPKVDAFDPEQTAILGQTAAATEPMRTSHLIHFSLQHRTPGHPPQQHTCMDAFL